jgi:glutaconyl-CoA/methylmalonyl-CoA decarboxylase subunit gamma
LEEEMDVTADIPGMIIQVKVKPGDEVKLGDALFVMEAMKMEMEVPAPGKGRVAAVHVKENEVVQAGQVLAVLR